MVKRFTTMGCPQGAIYSPTLWNINNDSLHELYDNGPVSSNGYADDISLYVIGNDLEEMAQTMAIVRFVARKVGMAGKTDMEFFKADMVACHFEDIFSRLPGLRFAKTQEDRVTKAKEMMEEFLPKWLAPLETILKKRGGEWYSGSGPTYADLAMMVALDFLHAPEEMSFKDINNLKERRALLDKYPLVKANYQRTCALPTSISWKAKKPAFHGF